MQELRTGRALQLEGLQFARNKVTLGFKCDAGTKIQLAQEAQQHGMTLSEYVDTLIANRFSKQSSYESLTHSERQQKIIRDLEEKVSFYESDILKKAFYAHQGKTITYKNYKGKDEQRTINRIEDVFAVLTNTVKLV